MPSKQDDEAEANVQNLPKSHEGAHENLPKLAAIPARFADAARSLSLARDAACT